MNYFLMSFRRNCGSFGNINTFIANECLAVSKLLVDFKASVNILKFYIKLVRRA